MEISSIANLATTMKTTRTEQEIGIAVLKKALHAEAASAAALIQALPPVQSNLPPHLGQNINTKA
ncbi:putative motility protein [Noviherbaspirillum cavernae]|uniref:Putative motility protein n=1 Tax=Noviherbaspirillum cavernae TaxID=2320862 RepID=A0A418X107_9BURK|nr:YjfB family protein [Noviherbaspirillum cavernae]RJG06015.1 putative motility protein [Noviherbaspirillum cavernae]